MKLCLKCARLKMSGNESEPCGTCLLLNTDPRATLRERLDAAIREERQAADGTVDPDLEKFPIRHREGDKDRRIEMTEKEYAVYVATQKYQRSNYVSVRQRR